MCVRQTKVVDNVINASLYLKFTDLRRAYSSDLINLEDEQVKHKFTQKRDYLLNKGVHNGQQRTDAEEKKLIALIESDMNVLVYASCNMMFTIDDKTKKIVKLTFDRRITSILSADSVL